MRSPGHLRLRVLGAVHDRVWTPTSVIAGTIDTSVRSVQIVLRRLEHDGRVQFEQPRTSYVWRLTSAGAAERDDLIAALTCAQRLHQTPRAS